MPYKAIITSRTDTESSPVDSHPATFTVSVPIYGQVAHGCAPEHQVPSPPGFAHPLLPDSPRLSTPADGPSELERLVTGEHSLSVHLREESRPEQDRYQVTIDMLPDDVLVEIFNFHTNGKRAWPSDWHTLIHVCQRWRHLVFASPRHLGLRLLFTGKESLTEMLDVWPRLPIVIAHARSRPLTSHRVDNIVALLDSEHHDRVHQIDLTYIAVSHWERIAAMMQKPFPELTALRIDANVEARAFSNPFFAPHLRSLYLNCVPFPAKPQLLSANDLVSLCLRNIPDSGYISPEMMVTCLSAMTGLNTLWLEFRSPQSRPDPAARHSPPLTRTVLPALAQFVFRGVREYLEVIPAWIDAPLLCHLMVDFFMDLNFDVPHLHRFIGFSEVLKQLREATVIFFKDAVMITFDQQPTPTWPGFWRLQLHIRCRESDWLLSSTAQLCHSSLPPFSSLEQLKIFDRTVGVSGRPDWKEDMEDIQWLEFLEPFTAVKNLRLSEAVAPQVGYALQEVAAERVTKVLPALQNLYIEGLLSSHSVQKVFGRFIVSRALSGQTIAIHDAKPYD